MQNKILAIVDFKASKDKDGLVHISGYANTKNEPDRYGDIPTVFEERRDYVYDIENFKTNPVMLIDHKNEVEYIAGSFPIVKEDEKGLFVEGVFSNSDLPMIKHAKQIYLEGHGKALSIAGKFRFEDEDNPNNLTLAEIYEISLVSVAADPNALAEAVEKAITLLHSERKDIIEALKSVRDAEKFLKTDLNLSSSEAKILISRIKSMACDEPVLPVGDDAAIENENEIRKATKILSDCLAGLNKGD